MSTGRNRADGDQAAGIQRGTPGRRTRGDFGQHDYASNKHNFSRQFFPWKFAPSVS